MSGLNKTNLLRCVLILLLLLVSISLTSANDVYYEINETESGFNISSTIQLSCDKVDPGCPTSRWGFSWQLLEGSELISVKDQYGEINEYDLQGNSLSFTTNRGDLDTNQTVKIKARASESREDRFNGLKKRFLSLPGYAGSETTGVVRSEDLLTATGSTGSQLGFNDEGMVFQAEGPVNINLNLGSGREVGNYVFFGDSKGNSSFSQMAYRTALGVTGNQPRYDKLPVMMLSPDIYSRERGNWSSGVYTEATITLKNNLGDREPAVLAHETVHAINDEVMDWDRRETAYLDEGLATYTEYLVNKRMYREKETDRVPPELFGEKIEFTERKGTKITRYEVPPNGNKDKLWNYYQQEGDFMKNWHPKQSRNRDFGYAYSQLIIRNHLKNNGTLKQIYQNLSKIEKDLETNQAKWDRLNQFVDLEPCNKPTRSQFENCLEQINDKDYPILSAEPSESNNSLKVEELELKKRNRSKGFLEGDNMFSAVEQLQKINLFIENRVETIVKWIKNNVPQV